MAQGISPWFQAIKHLGDLRNCEKVEFAAKRDQGCATVPSGFDGQLVCGELFSERSGGVR